MADLRWACGLLRSPGERPLYEREANNAPGCCWRPPRQEDVAGAVAAVACTGQRARGCALAVRRPDGLRARGGGCRFSPRSSTPSCAFPSSRYWETTTSSPGSRSRSAGSSLKRGSRCSTARPSRCKGSESPGRKASRAASDARPWVPGASLRPSASCRKRSTRP